MKSTNIDIPLSEEIAKQASQQINEISRELENNKDSHILFLKDVLSDMKDQRKFLNGIVKWAFAAILLLIISLFGLSIYNQRVLKDMAEKNNAKIMEFMESAEFYTEVELLTDNESVNTGGISMSK